MAAALERLVQRVTYADNLPPLRNQLARGVRMWNVDASLFKAIPFKERYTIRFKADFFNVFNHPGNPNSIGSNGVLGKVGSGQAPRVLQLTFAHELVAPLPAPKAKTVNQVPIID